MYTGGEAWFLYQAWRWGGEDPHQLYHAGNAPPHPHPERIKWFKYAMAEFAVEEHQAQFGQGPLAERAKKLKMLAGQERQKQMYAAETRLPGGGFGTKSGHLEG